MNFTNCLAKNAYTKMRAILMLFILASLAACNVTLPVAEQRATKTTHDPFILASKGDAAYEVGNWLIAERYYHALAQQVPNDGYAWSRLGNIRLRQHNFTAAIHAYEQALQRNSDDPRTHYNLATAHLLQARAALRKAQVSLPSKDPAVALIAEKLHRFEALVYGPVIEIASPIDGLITQGGH